MDGQGQLDRAQVRAQVAAGGGHRLDDEGPHLFGQLRQLFLVEVLDVRRRLDAVQDHGSRTTLARRVGPGAAFALRSVRTKETTATPSAARASTCSPC